MKRETAEEGSKEGRRGKTFPLSVQSASGETKIELREDQSQSESRRSENQKSVQNEPGADQQEHGVRAASLPAAPRPGTTHPRAATTATAAAAAATAATSQSDQPQPGHGPRLQREPLGHAGDAQASVNSESVPSVGKQLHFLLAVHAELDVLVDPGKAERRV